MVATKGPNTEIHDPPKRLSQGKEREKENPPNKPTILGGIGPKGPGFSRTIGVLTATQAKGAFDVTKKGKRKSIRPPPNIFINKTDRQKSQVNLTNGDEDRVRGYPIPTNTLERSVQFLLLGTWPEAPSPKPRRLRLYAWGRDDQNGRPQKIRRKKKRLPGHPSHTPHNGRHRLDLDPTRAWADKRFWGYIAEIEEGDILNTDTPYKVTAVGRIWFYDDR